MLGLNETALHHPAVGQAGGKPAFSAAGTSFRCRSEPACQMTPEGRSYEKGADIRLFAQGIAPEPGDRIVLDGRNYIVAETRRMRGFRSLHHVEIMLKADHT